AVDRHIIYRSILEFVRLPDSKRLMVERYDGRQRALAIVEIDAERAQRLAALADVGDLAAQQIFLPWPPRQGQFHLPEIVPKDLVIAVGLGSRRRPGRGFRRLRLPGFLV